MFENENEVEQPQLDVDSEASSEPKAAEDSGEVSRESKQQADNTPFHEHPRFKEVIEAKNQYAKKAQELEQRLADMDKRFQDQDSRWKQSQTQEDKLVKRLKDIDPEFGQRFEELAGLPKQLQEFNSWRQAQVQEQIQAQAANAVSQLHSQYKIPQELQTVYNKLLIAEEAARPGMTVKDIPAVYKTIHDMFNKHNESLKRSERASYVKDKGADAQVPRTTKGKPVMPSGQKQYPKDEAQARDLLVKQVLKVARAERDF